MHDWEIEQLDVKTAFLYGKIDTEVYVEQPHGFEHGGAVCRLIQLLYRLKQLPQLWSLTISAYLCKNGFTVSEADPGILINGNGVILVLYVDDVLLVGPSLADINTIKALLCRKFEISDMGSCSFYLGMQLHRNRDAEILFLGQ